MKIFKELKKLGYKHYTENTIEELDNLPLDSEERIMEQSLVLRWFREKYGLHSYIEPVLVEKANSPIKYDYVILEVSHQNDLEYNNLPYHTFEEAELACLIKLIQIVKL